MEKENHMEEKEEKLPEEKEESLPMEILEAVSGYKPWMEK